MMVRPANCWQTAKIITESVRRLIGQLICSNHKEEGILTKFNPLKTSMNLG